MSNPIQRLGQKVLDALRGLGHNATFFVDLLRNLPAAFRRPFLIVAQVHAIGNLSLLIIMASGLAVGFVLALQSYYALVTYGASESLGLLVNLSLVRELGPVVTALLFSGRAGTSLTAEIGLMKAGEQLAAMEMMAIDPKSRVLAPRFIGGVVAMPVLAVLFSAVGIFGRLRRRSAADRRGRRQFLVDHAERRRRLARRGQRHHQELCLRRDMYLRRGVSRL